MNNELTKLTTDYDSYIVDTLKDKQEAAIYLQTALDEYQMDGDSEALLLAFKHIANAQGGITKLAKKTNLNRVSLYRTLSSKGNPRLQTLGLILKALGFHLSVSPA